MKGALIIDCDLSRSDGFAVSIPDAVWSILFVMTSTAYNREKGSSRVSSSYYRRSGHFPAATKLKERNQRLTGRSRRTALEYDLGRKSKLGLAKNSDWQPKKYLCWIAPVVAAIGGVALGYPRSRGI